MHRAILAKSIVILLLAGIAGCGDDRTGEHDFKVERVIDGDTIVLTDERIVRYIGIDTPERGEPYYEQAKEANWHMVKGKDVRLELDQEEKDRYGRTLAYAHIGDTFVNLELVSKGYALAYPYPPNVRYKDVFADAEEEARQERIGIWSFTPQGRVGITEIHFDPEGDDRDNLNGEWIVVISNADVPIHMTGFTLSDSSDHIYVFGDFTLPADSLVTIFTGSGDDTDTSLYWDSKTPIWNNDGDTAYLKDSYGVLIDEYSY